MQALTLDVILRAVLGPSDERLAADIRARSACASLPRLVAMSLPARPAAPARGTPSCGAGARSTSSSRRSSPRRRAAGAGGSTARRLLAAGIDDAELRDQVVTLLAAGHETTAGSLAWALERLAHHPAAHARVRAGDEAYLDAVVKEVLRVRPVLDRRAAARRALRVAGHELPPGVHVAPCIYLAHRRPEAYPDRALPPRALPGAPRPPESGTYLPFGGGVRRCAGAAFATLEMREVLRAVAERFALAPARPARRAHAPARLTLQPGDGARVAFSDACAASSS